MCIRDSQHPDVRARHVAAFLLSSHAQSLHGAAAAHGVPAVGLVYAHRGSGGRG